MAPGCAAPAIFDSCAAICASIRETMSVPREVSVWISISPEEATSRRSERTARESRPAESGKMKHWKAGASTDIRRVDPATKRATSASGSKSEVRSLPDNGAGPRTAAGRGNGSERDAELLEGREPERHGHTGREGIEGTTDLEIAHEVRYQVDSRCDDSPICGMDGRAQGAEIDALHRPVPFGSKQDRRQGPFHPVAGRASLAIARVESGAGQSASSAAQSVIPVLLNAASRASCKSP